MYIKIKKNNLKKSILPEITRDKCYKCFRTLDSCMCKYIKQIDTNTTFIILMHTKEFKKTKNGTGHFTNLSLLNSKLYIGIDFSNHDEINELINDKNNNCYILYPGENSIKLNTQSVKVVNKHNIVFIIDSTWSCSKGMIEKSKNLKNLPKISFEHNKSSSFKIKTQPNSYCLSTIESTLCVLELLNEQNLESIKKKSLDNFLKPFHKMIEYQISCCENNNNFSVRYKKPYKKL